MLSLKAKDCLGRICDFQTKHGKIETPCLLPVINPNQMLISPSEMEKLFKISALITNSYIIYKNEDLREKAIKNGLHSLLNFDKSIMTDSGTFQQHVYGDLQIENKEIINFQKQIKSDIITILDLFSEVDDKKGKVKEDVEGTIKRAKEGYEFLEKSNAKKTKDDFNFKNEKDGDKKSKKDMNFEVENAVNENSNTILATTIQGGRFIDLREFCAKELKNIGDFYPIGSVVPLMENYNYGELVDIILTCKKNLNIAKPIHLFGCGHPMFFSLAVLCGVDFFDSSSYVKYAKDSRLMFNFGTRLLNELEELPCNCPICNSLNAKELKAMEKEERVKKIALHNLYVSFYEIRRIKQAIYEENLFELVEQRCRNHPYLLNGLRKLKEHNDYFECFESLSKKSAFFYTGIESLHRPIIHRYEKRLFERYEPPKAKVLISLEENKKPYSKTYSKLMKKILNFCNAHFIVNSAIAPVPIELDEIYPIAQSVFPENFEEEVRKRMNKLTEKFMHKFGSKYEFSIIYEGEKTMEFLKEMFGKEDNVNLKKVEMKEFSKSKEKFNFVKIKSELSETKSCFNLDLQKVKSVCNFQFGGNAGQILTNGEVKIVKSKNTQKIRNVFLNGKHVLSLRANDGFFTLKKEGAILLHKEIKFPKLRVVVEKETAEFNKQGKNVFAKFVLNCDEDLRVGDECLVVDEKDNLYAIGKLEMNKEEMLNFKNGIAVKVREGI